MRNFAVFCDLYHELVYQLWPGAAAFAQKSMAAKLKDVPGMISVLQQLVIDQFVYFPVVYFPVFYTCKELAAQVEDSVTECLNQAIAITEEVLCEEVAVHA